MPDLHTNELLSTPSLTSVPVSSQGQMAQLGTARLGTAAGAPVAEAVAPPLPHVPELMDCSTAVQLSRVGPGLAVAEEQQAPSISKTAAAAGGEGCEQAAGVASTPPHALDTVFSELQSAVLSDEQQGSLVLIPTPRVSAKGSRQPGCARPSHSPCAAAVQARAASMASTPQGSPGDAAGSVTEAASAQAFPAHAHSCAGPRAMAAIDGPAAFAPHARSMASVPWARAGSHGVAPPYALHEVAGVQLPAYVPTAWQDDVPGNSLAQVVCIEAWGAGGGHLD